MLLIWWSVDTQTLLNTAQVFNVLMELPLLQVVHTDILYLKLLIAFIAAFGLCQ
jgi:hypothetical protein